MSTKSVAFTLLVLVLFTLAAGFQLWIFAALYHSGGSIRLVDPFPQVRMFEFALASAIFTVVLIALCKFFSLLWRGGNHESVGKR